MKDAIVLGTVTGLVSFLCSALFGLSALASYWACTLLF